MSAKLYSHKTAGVDTDASLELIRADMPYHVIAEYSFCLSAKLIEKNWFGLVYSEGMQSQNHS